MGDLASGIDAKSFGSSRCSRHKVLGQRAPCCKVAMGRPNCKYGNIQGKELDVQIDLLEVYAAAVFP